MNMSPSHYAVCVVILAFIVSSCATPGETTTTSANDTEDVAWWLEQEFEPTQQRLNGIALHEFDSNWRRATMLEPQLLQDKLNRRQYQEFLRSEQSLKIDADLDGNGEAERFMVGVYDDNAGATGRFLAIVEGGKVLQVFQYPGPQTYSGLLFTGGELHWYKCMICDDFDIINWGGGRYELSYRQHSPMP